MRISETDNIRHGIDNHADRTFYDHGNPLDDEYDVCMYVTFRSECRNLKPIRYAIMFNSDYYKCSDELHKLVAMTVKSGLGAMTANGGTDTEMEYAVKEYFEKRHDFILGSALNEVVKDGCVEKTVLDYGYKLERVEYKYLMENENL